ncbi:MAG: O-succinylbenzoic acid--CoA ligase, partial [Bacteroides sp.]
MNLNRREQYITLEGKRYSSEDISRLSASVTAQTPPMMVELYAFLEEWFDDSLTMTVHTSGSTGTPKEWIVRKEQMMQSARLTCEVLKLAQGDTALLCMSLQYIAGKMMVVRALVGELNLIVRTPSGHPLADVKGKIRFAAMVPLQVYNTLDTPEE